MISTRSPQSHLSRDVNRPMDGAIHRAALVMNRMHAFDCLPVRTRGGEVVGHVNAFDDQDFLLELDLTGDIGR